MTLLLLKSLDTGYLLSNALFKIAQHLVSGKFGDALVKIYQSLTIGSHICTELTCYEIVYRCPEIICHFYEYLAAGELSPLPVPRASRAQFEIIQHCGYGRAPCFAECFQSFIKHTNLLPSFCGIC